MTIKLYSYWRSSSSYRVRIVLALKKIDVEYVPIHLLTGGGAQFSGDYRARNPLEQVPVLEVDDESGSLRLTQSVAICEYLDERWPDASLLPAHAGMRAQVRKCVEIVNSGIQPMQNLSLLRELKHAGVDEKAFAKRANERGLGALEIEAKSMGGERLVGDSLTLADVFLVPQIYAARRFGIDVEAAFPTLARIDRALTNHPAFAAAHPDRQPDAEPAPTT